MAEFDFQPTLQSDLVTVRPVRPEDWPGLYAVGGDPEVWAGHPVRDRWREEVFRAFFDGALALGSAFTFVDNASGRIIGSSRYHGHDPVLSEVEIGWTFLARDCWGGDYNREVKRLMLAHAFGFVDTVVFWVGETNIRSQKAMEKIGGRGREGLHDRAYGPQPVRHVIYEITRAAPGPLFAD
jgi:N-acetyltransferase